MDLIKHSDKSLHRKHAHTATPQVGVILLKLLIYYASYSNIQSYLCAATAFILRSKVPKRLKLVTFQNSKPSKFNKSVFDSIISPKYPR